VLFNLRSETKKLRIAKAHTYGGMATAIRNYICAV
jgi:hypothetical protein